PSTANRSDPEDPVEKILNRSDPEDPRVEKILNRSDPEDPDPEDPRGPPPYPAASPSPPIPCNHNRNPGPAWHRLPAVIHWMPEEKPYMTIHLPTDLENSLRAEVSIGHFASLDDAMAEAVRLLLRNRTQRQPEACPDTSL